MNEWTVVTVLIAITGLIGTIVTPIIKLTSCINRLSGQVDALLKNLDEFKKRYQRNFDELKVADKELDDRITVVEKELAKLAQHVNDLHEH